MHKLGIVLLLFLFCIPGIACEYPAQRKVMAQHLFQEADYLFLICGDQKCTEEYFADQLEYRAAEVRRVPKINVCFVEPIRKPRNMYIGVFVIELNRAPKPQFIFFGSGIKVLNRSHKGMRDLEALEIIDAGSSEKFLYRWNGSAYTED